MLKKYKTENNVQKISKISMPTACIIFVYNVTISTVLLFLFTSILIFLKQIYYTRNITNKYLFLMCLSQ